MKLFGLFMTLFAVGSILYEKVIDPKKFEHSHPVRRWGRAVTDWGLLVLGIVIMLFAPWSCE